MKEDNPASLSALIPTPQGKGLLGERAEALSGRHPIPVTSPPARRADEGQKDTWLNGAAQVDQARLDGRLEESACSRAAGSQGGEMVGKQVPPPKGVQSRGRGRLSGA